MKKILFAAFLSFAGPAVADDFMDTQYGPNGWEVHLLRATVANDVLTVAFMIENTGSSADDIDSMDVTEVAYTTSDKKFPVLTDANGEYLASTITYQQNEDGNLFRGPDIDQTTFYFSKGDRQVGWVKFEAPGDADWPIDLSLPGVSPFIIAKPAE